MSDIEKLFLAAYPLWPKQLLEKFSNLFSFEVAKFNPEINPQIREQYKSLGMSQRIRVTSTQNNSVSLLTSGDSRWVTSQNYSFNRTIYWAESLDGSVNSEIVRDAAKYNQEFTGKIYYDSRIFERVNVGLDIETYRAGRYDMLGRDLRNAGYYIEYLDYTAFLNVNSEMHIYSGASSVLAMMENGVPIESKDTDKLSEFVTFLTAYKKYNGELSAANNLEAEKNRQSINEYRNAISEKLSQRKNDLNDLKLQISFNAKNETSSAKRDMQSLALTAQSLMLQVKQALK